MGLSSRVRRLLPVALGIVAPVAILAALTVSDEGAVDIVCNIGSSLDQPAYQLCLAELPARQAQHDEAVRAGTSMMPVVALAGGVIVAMAAHLVVRARTPNHPPVDDDPWTLGRGARTG